MQKREYKTTFRLTLAERLKLKRMANMSGRSVESFIRERVLDNRKVPVMDSETMKKIYVDLNAIGKDIAQFARAANKTGKFDRATLLFLLNRESDIMKLFEGEILNAWKAFDE